MGRRSRTREKAAAPSTGRPARKPRPRAATPAPVGSAMRRVVGFYTVGAMVMALLVLVGIVVLRTDLGPFIVVGYAVLGAGLLHHWVRTRLDGQTITGDERMLRTVASGLLIMAIGFAVLDAVLVLAT